MRAARPSTAVTGDRAESAVLEQSPQQHPRLEQRKLGTQAVVGTAAEGHPAVGLWSRADEAVGPEGQRVWVEFGALVQRHDPNQDVRAARDEESIEVELLQRAATGERQCRPHRNVSAMTASR